MTSLKYTEKYFVVCYLVLFLVINADAEISLAQYFGTDSAISSERDRFVHDCNTEELQKSCYEKCGPNYACLPGQCICFEERASPIEVSDEESTEVTSNEENNREPEIGNENESQNKNVHVSKTLQCLINQHRNTEGNSNRASSEESNSVDENSAASSALRHHIAHFCPNLDKARDCIRKCMKLYLPAFCGKDHVCYCGHKGEEKIVEVSKLDPAHSNEMINPFRDLYERYFGILH